MEEGLRAIVGMDSNVKAGNTGNAMNPEMLKMCAKVLGFRHCKADDSIFAGSTEIASHTVSKTRGFLQTQMKGKAGIPDDLEIAAPKHKLQVVYPLLPSLAPGDTLGLNDTLEPPSLRFSEAKKGKFYTIAMVDPDAPSKKKSSKAQWLHWIVTNVEGLILSIGTSGSTEARDYSTMGIYKMLVGHSIQITDGDEVMMYAGPSPPKGSGPHRYVFLAWQQQKKVQMETPDSRAGGNISRIAKKLSIGSPVAGNFFLAEAK